ncbi:uncharacterized protein LOC114726859 [Neltuma alba]|uniref:uncharacterized protein LOC114726859 n=1 Tax=Neltuma alba TaxID=207710 RepID=UPI0010A3D59F|nr:uncharacterized protein LOC114726859 [Prosopis alba]
MESDKTAITSKEMKVEVPCGSENGMELQGVVVQGHGGGGGLTRQTSMSKTNCLCSPTTHTGSFRCRLHRTTSLNRTKSIESASTLPDQLSTVADIPKDQIH